MIAVTATGPREAEPYVASLTSRHGEARLVAPSHFASVNSALDGVSGLLMCGGYDVAPALYGGEVDPNAGVETYPARDEMELAVFREALRRDLPILAICRGMQLVNVAFGGKLIQNLPDHGPGRTNDDDDRPVTHPVYVSPGSKLGAILGAGAIYRTNSLHHQGMKDAQLAPRLLASAYHPMDGIIEALESPDHAHLIGVQCHPEREAEVSKGFLKLFDWLVGWAEERAARGMA